MYVIFLADGFHYCLYPVFGERRGDFRKRRNRAGGLCLWSHQAIFLGRRLPWTLTSMEYAGWRRYRP